MISVAFMTQLRQSVGILILFVAVADPDISMKAADDLFSMLFVVKCLRINSNNVEIFSVTANYLIALD